MKCLILENAEISEEECRCIVEESYKEKNKKGLPKKVKVVMGWKMICRQCRNHQQNQLK